MRVLTAGSRALLVELDAAAPSLDPDPAQLYRALAEMPPVGAVEFVPAARTVLVGFDPERTSPVRLTADIAAAAEATQVAALAAAPADDPREVVEIPVEYDGPDLESVAELTDSSIDEVVRRHSAPLYEVAFCGFAPGFGYLTGLDPTLHLPRRPVPRTRVPAGSVAISDRYCGGYPHPSPGGWHLLGRTRVAVWDVARQPPALLVPGARVRFVPSDGRGNASGQVPGG